MQDKNNTAFLFSKKSTTISTKNNQNFKNQDFLLYIEKLKQMDKYQLEQEMDHSQFDNIIKGGQRLETFYQEIIIPLFKLNE